MRSFATPNQPRFAHATPLSLLRLKGDPQTVVGRLKVEWNKLEPVGETLYSARIDVPSGEWLIWLDAGAALWIGDRPDALPGPVRKRLIEGSPDELVQLVDRLADVGVWCREAALLIDGEWTSSKRAHTAFAALTARTATAMSGVFVDREGRAARLEVSRGSVCWSDRPELAIEWLLATANLPRPV
jgi:hypothetical protein